MTAQMGTVRFDYKTVAGKKQGLNRGDFITKFHQNCLDFVTKTIQKRGEGQNIFLEKKNQRKQL
ncbi:MAG: hypothetical protein J6V90_02745 [Treponema sp.]|nr:hypothetical protein [Treponema sp.]